MLIGKYSSSAHELLLQFLSVSHWSVVLVEMVLDRRRDERTLDLEGPGERSTPEGELQALGGGVQVRAPAGCPTGWIGDDLQAMFPLAGHDSQQIVLRGPLPTPHARASRSRDRVGGHAGARAFGLQWRAADQSSV